MSTLNCAARSAAKILQYSTAYATLTKHILINHSHSHHTEPLSGPSVFDLSVCGRPQFQLYVPPLHLYTCGLTCTPQLHSTVYSSACRRSIGYLGGQCGARSTSDPLQLRVEWWEREFALALGGRLHLQWRETATMSSLRFLRPSDSGGWPTVEAVVYSTGLPFLSKRGVRSQRPGWTHERPCTSHVGRP